MDLKQGTPEPIHLAQLQKHLFSAPRELDWRYFKTQAAQLLQDFWHWCPAHLSPQEKESLYPDLSRPLTDQQKSWCYALCLSFWTLKAIPTAQTFTIFEQTLPDFWRELNPETLFLDTERREEWLRFWCKQAQMAIAGETPEESERRWLAISSQQRAQLYRRLRQRKRRRAQQRNGA